jgi:F420-dependent oxidoreductase-like protein
MRIGITCGGGTPTDRVINQVTKAEEDGFTSVWFPGGGGADALPAMAVAGRSTEQIELGTAIQQTYMCHPILAAQRAAAVVDAMGRPGFTFGLGPGHAPHVVGVYRESYEHPGRHTEHYLEIVSRLLAGQEVDVVSDDVSAAGGVKLQSIAHEVPLLVAALGPRLLRVAADYSAGTILWMANAASIRDHVAPHLAAAEGDGTRIVAGLPIAVTDDVDAARAAAATAFHVYGTLPNYQRILAAGGISSPEQAVIVGDEVAVAEQLQELMDAGATDIWAAPFPVGDDKRDSLARTRRLLVELAA